MSGWFWGTLYGAAGFLCLLSTLGFRHLSNKNGPRLPPVMALTILKLFTFSAFCIFVGLDQSPNTDVPDRFGAFLLFPLAVIFCVLLSGVAFLLTILAVRLLPKGGTNTLFTAKRIQVSVAVNAAVFCVGAILGCVVYYSG